MAQENTQAISIANTKEELISKVALQMNRSEDEVSAMISVSFPTLKTVGQLTTAFSIAAKYDLDPSVKEIYAYIDSRGNLTVIVGKDGFLKIARKQPGYISVNSVAVFLGDTFEIDLAEGRVLKHIIGGESMKARTGNPIGAYSILRMEGKPDIINWVDWAEYAGSGGPWAKQKSAMIRKCATSTLCREAFGLSGLYDEAEMETGKEQPDNLAQLARAPIEPAQPVEEIKAEVVKKQEEAKKAITEEKSEPLPPIKTTAKQKLAAKQESDYKSVTEDPRYEEMFNKQEQSVETVQEDAPEEIQEDATEEVTPEVAEEVFGEVPPQELTEEEEKAHYRKLVNDAKDQFAIAVAKWKKEPTDENAQKKSDAKKVYDGYMDIVIKRGWVPAKA